jgi:hypothetical protein
MSYQEAVSVESIARARAAKPIELWFRLEEIQWIEYAVRVAQCNEPDVADSFEGATDVLEDKLYEALTKCEDMNARRIKCPRVRRILVKFTYDEVKWTEYASKTVLSADPDLVDDYPGATEYLDERLFLAKRQLEAGYGKRVRKYGKPGAGK